ncbi:MAG TPA: response regulator [Alphaproteobacteria bacterium]|nr:response regulator [Alphaproteobacteria bacterium]
MARILLIEDEDSVRATLRKVLESAGYDVLEAANGEQALRLEESGPVDLVVTDIIMPQMDGFGAIHLLRKRDPELAILAMTGGTADYLQAARDHGAGEVLQKPFDNKTLLDTVSGLLAAD